MIVDANLLLYAVDTSAPQHGIAREWFQESLNGHTQVGLPWPSLLAFVRISTHPRIAQHPLSGEAAWSMVDTWLTAPTVWIPEPTAAHADVMGRLVRSYGLTGNLIPDAHLAALAIEYGTPLCSTDTDFSRFTEIEWINPIDPRTR